MKPLLASLLLLLAFAVNASADSLRVATFNVNWQNRHWDAILTAITSAEPDIVALQETTPELERFLRKRLSATHPHFYSTGNDGRYGAERFCFASRGQLTDLTYSLPTVGMFGFYSATASTDAGPVRLINVHLKPFLIDRRAGVAEIMRRISDTEGIHVAEVEAIAGTIGDDEPTIVLGDFNSISTFQAPQRMLTLGFVDAFANLHVDADSRPTWRWPTRPLPLSLRIDYIFHSSHFTTLAAEIITTGGSDHSLCVAEVMQRPEGG